MKQNMNEQTGSGAHAQRISSYVNTLKDLNFTLSDHATVLDFGCGSGAQVKEYRRLGYEAFGCDLQFKDGPDVSWMHQEAIIRLISRNPYRVPLMTICLTLL